MPCRLPRRSSPSCASSVRRCWPRGSSC